LTPAGSPLISRKFLDQTIVQFLCPFFGQEVDECRPSLEEFRPVALAAVVGAGTGHALGVAPPAPHRKLPPNEFRVEHTAVCFMFNIRDAIYHNQRGTRPGVLETNASLSPNVNFSPGAVIAGISATVRFVQKPRPTNNLSEAVDEVS
jgi:hypothetical protein